jgi:hypothetical protein
MTKQKWDSVSPSKPYDRKGHRRKDGWVSTSKAFRIRKHERDGSYVDSAKNIENDGYKRRPRRTKKEIAQFGRRKPLKKKKPSKAPK